MNALGLEVVCQKELQLITLLIAEELMQMSQQAIRYINCNQTSLNRHFIPVHSLREDNVQVPWRQREMLVAVLLNPAPRLSRCEGKIVRQQ